MTIAENLMNPVPMHSATSLFYDNRRTYKGAFSHPIVPNGRVLPFQLTADADGATSVLPTLSIAMTLSGGTSVVMTSSMAYTTTGVMTYISGGYILTVTQVAGGYTLHLINVSANVDLYIASDNLQTSIETLDDSRFVWSEAQMRNATATTYSAYVYDDNQRAHYVYDSTITKTRNALVATNNVTASVISCATDTSVATATLTMNYSMVRADMYNSNRHATITTTGSSVSGVDDGVYYLQTTIGGITLYSEPFVWISDTSRTAHVNYRRNIPVVTAENCMPFMTASGELNMEMYIPAEIMMPPFTFDATVEEMDGRKMVQKLVSYRSDKMQFPCTGYFAEALRLLWHCNDRTITQHSRTHSVDYMEPPEIEWDDDNHLCIATVEFQSDTIVQTNGEAIGQSTISTGVAFNGSFNESFS